MLTEILIVQAVGSAVLSAIVAYNKNRHVTGWCLLGALFGVLGLVAVASVGKVQQMGSHQEEDHENQAEESEPQESEPQESQVQEGGAEESQRPAAGGQRETT